MLNDDLRPLSLSKLKSKLFAVLCFNRQLCN